MKLLNCSTLKIEEFFGSSIPKSYAVLSHRWEDDEVSYQDVTANTPQTLTQKRGWAKIRQTCRVALERGLDYAWVDTCCIDKTSSADLSEAVNSMFKWYADAAVCFAFLSDVGAGQAFAESLWWTRGWTLQELVAPREVLFFDREWELMGTRAQLCEVIHGLTGIGEKILMHGSEPGPSIRTLLSGIPVAVRMSWAATRVTTREEDRAYSLLGIFGINMPILYGEGNAAFMRLQEEIIKGMNDLTLFAWTSISGGVAGQDLKDYRGILATSPHEFRNSGTLELSRDTRYNPEYTMTNKGLRVVANVTVPDSDVRALSLGCHFSSDTSKSQVGIYLEGQGGGVYLRAKPHTLAELSKNALESSHAVYIRRHVEAEAAAEVATQMQSVPRGAVRIHILSRTIELVSAGPAGMWNPQRKMFVTDGEDRFAGYVHLRQPGADGSVAGVVACGFDPEAKLWFCPGHNGIDEIYEAAMSGDMKRMRALAIKKGKSQIVKRTLTTTAGLQITGTVGRQGYDVSIDRAECIVM